MNTQSNDPKFLFIFRHPDDLPDPSPQEMQQIFEKWMAWMGSLRERGVYHGGDRLQDGGRVVRNPRTGKSTDGPFVEGKEVIGGFIVVSARDLAAATVLAKECPGLEGVHSVEVRPVEPM
jgi:hypothetical protein